MPARSLYAKLIKRLRRSFPDADLTVVQDAYRVAEAAHRNQVRASGDPYITHTVNTAIILANLGLDPVTCAAGLLHDVLEDTSVTRAELQAKFGKEITAVVEGVTKINQLSFRDDLPTLEMKQAQNIRKMLVATAQDLRVIMIKMADRLHNMRTLEFLDPERRERISRETLDIYAPLAHRLGISSWKWEMEDHAFHHLMPDTYKEIARMVAMKRHEREVYLMQTVALLEKKLLEAEVAATVIGRPKHLYSIYEKMTGQGKDFSQVLDVLGIRIITQTDAGCYNALGAVHSLWTPIPGRLKDYIAMPKLNMYQA
ncbi:MAG: bifunctional (p)ppGpp synthetase/guanosine-3',5'-bis(diphosphate) 3'-pyrophosphohydrolase, partial [Candidatus Hydrogenedens sp.]|nr:bifunctional (p)ppGpp synthetase/guanosine-3',5'-bis(diphosphate) 3'-pyrophosphohydrolase [Candidatus Hydrogenedens sp.]